MFYFVTIFTFEDLVIILQGSTCDLRTTKTNKIVDHSPICSTVYDQITRMIQSTYYLLCNIFSAWKQLPFLYL